MKKIISTIILLSLLIFLIFKPLTIQETIKNTIIIWLDKIFLNLFIYFIVIDLLFNLKIPDKIGNIFFPLFKKIFKITTPNSSFIIISSLFLGSPIIQKYLNDLVINKEITIEEANYLVKFTSNVNPIFIINVISIYYTKLFSFLFLFSIFLSNFIISLIYKPKKFFLTLEINNNNKNKKTEKFTLTNSISNNLESLFNILGIMIFFSVLIAFFINLDINCFYYNSIKNYLIIPLELITGIEEINSSYYSINIKHLLTLFILVFGGFSMHFQIKSSFISIDYKNFLKSKILQVIISIIIFIIIQNFF